ncbi:MAG TPA: spermidine synthase, partial [Candidatus Sumerlaeota bacterium]|nr:spermidine synthase [Candidatus Sumerlaeota bacterium]
MLAAFMGGLALGSLLGGRAADRVRRPLFCYGVLELAIAATAVAVPAMLGLFDPLYRSVYASGSASFFTLSLLRFVFCFVVLLVPTTC